MPRSKNKINLV